MTVKWQLMALLLLRHALNLTNNNSDDEEDDPSAFFFVSKSLTNSPLHYLPFRFLVIVTLIVFVSLWFSPAFHASCCRFPPPLLHHGLGY